MERKIQIIKLTDNARIGGEQVSAVNFTHNENENKFTAEIDYQSRIVSVTHKALKNVTVIPFERISYIQYYAQSKAIEKTPSRVARNEPSTDASQANSGGPV